MGFQYLSLKFISNYNILKDAGIIIKLSQWKKIITEDVKKILKDTFKELKDTVTIEVYTKKDINDSFNETTTELISALAETSPEIKPSFYTSGDEISKKRNVFRSPTILIAPDKYNIRFTGSPPR